MELNFESEKPIFLQLSEQIENAILSGAYEEESQIPSTTDISVSYKINPATVLKGFNLLVDGEVIYKRRGVGMFVCKGAVQKLKERRKSEFISSYLQSLVDEAKKLNITKSEIINMIEREYDK